MAIVILSPQDYCLTNDGLRHRGPFLSPPPNPIPNSTSTSSNPNFNHEDSTCSGRRRRRRTPTNRPANIGTNRVGESSTAKNLAMGQVKILKRGEMLSSDGGGGGVGASMRSLESKPEDDLNLDLVVLGSTHQFGPDTGLMQKQDSDGTYAGSGAFFASPPPSLVPMPLFLDKNGTATNHLRRLLRLDLV